MGGPGASTSAQLGNLPARSGPGDVAGPSRASSSAQPVGELSPEEALVFKGYRLAQVNAIRRTGGRQALEAVEQHSDALHALGLTNEDVVRIASNVRGKKGVEAVIDLMPTLLERPHLLTKDQVVDMIASRASRPAP